MYLTILSYKSNAALDYNRDFIFSQLLVTEGVADGAGGHCDGGVPQSEVRLVEAVDVNSSVNKKKDEEEKTTCHYS